MTHTVVREIKLTGTDHRINDFFWDLNRQFPYTAHKAERTHGYYQALLDFGKADATRLDTFLHTPHFDLQVSSTPSNL